MTAAGTHVVISSQAHKRSIVVKKLQMMCMKGLPVMQLL
jgi:hypothetical protein